MRARARAWCLQVHYVVLPPGSGFSTSALGPERGADRWRVRDPALVATSKAAYGDPATVHAPRLRALFFRGSTRQSSSHSFANCMLIA